MARLGRLLLCASLLAAAHAAAETATCSDPLAASALPTPVVDEKALSAQARRLGSTCAHSAPSAHARALVPPPQIMKLSLISEAEAPAVTRLVYTKQDMEARECAGSPTRRTLALRSRSLVNCARRRYVKSLMRDAGLVVRCALRLRDPAVR